jgi:hypothetical protein
LLQPNPLPVPHGVLRFLAAGGECRPDQSLFFFSQSQEELRGFLLLPFLHWWLLFFSLRSSLVPCPLIIVSGNLSA